jgi:hypothetical protein
MMNLDTYTIPRLKRLCHNKEDANNDAVVEEHKEEYAMLRKPY